MKDPLRTETSALVGEMVAALGDALQGGKPYAFVGFAFGAILSYEVARGIAKAKPGEGPALVVPVSCEGPAWSGRASKMHKTSEPEFLDVLRKKGGTDFILKDAGMTKMYVPVIRADVTLEETYAPPKAGEVAGCPIIAVVGEKVGRDKEKSLVAKADAELWLTATSAPASKLVPLPAVDWYVLQEEAGVRAVLKEVTSFMSKLQAVELS